MGFKKVDHVTNNAMSMASVTLWMEHVMGMEQCWKLSSTRTISTKVHPPEQD